MKLYKKKPVVIAATRLTNIEQVQELVKLGCPIYINENSKMIIRTLEGEMEVRPFDYVIQGIAEEWYSCSAKIFHLTYEEV